MLGGDGPGILLGQVGCIPVAIAEAYGVLEWALGTLEQVPVHLIPMACWNGRGWNGRLLVYKRHEQLL